MLKNKWVVNVFIVILCTLAISVNTFFDEYKALGTGCILLMGILSIWRGNKK